MKSIERVQRRATKYILMLPFQTEWSYQDRLIQCNLLLISYWHEMMDLAFLYKATNGLIDIDRSILPTIRRSASYMDLAFLYKATNGLIDIDRSILPTIRRSARVTRSCHASNTTTYTTKRCRTLTYQCSFFIRTSRIWNSLPTYIRDNSLSLASFKNKLFEYYTNALLNIYNPGNPKTWKSVCPKCNMARPLVKDITCCF